MSQQNTDKARQASSAAFLEKMAKLRNQAAKSVLNEDLEQLRSGLKANTSVTELQLLERRAEQVETADRLDEVIKHRTDLRSHAISEEAEEPPHANQKRGRDLLDGGEWDEDRQALRKKPNFLAVQEDEIRDRIARHDYVAEKTEDELAAERYEARAAERRALAAVRRTLPIYQYRKELLELVRSNQVVVIIGETGSGKTTQLLQYLLEDGIADEGKSPQGEPLKLVCTQPRRIAAIGVADRVAAEMNERLGGAVGYKVRFDDKTSDATRVLFVTDGIMLKEMTSDPNLNNYAAIMIDEAHERSLNSDVLLGMLKDLVRRNKRLKVIIASATIQADKFCAFFDNCPKFVVKGRMFPVEISYTQDPVADYVAAAAETVMELHKTRPLPGDILVFLTGQEEIETCAALIEERTRALGNSIRELVVRPVYAALPPEEQKKIYIPAPREGRKVVIATNIAETSITLDGVVYVVDSGLCKQDFYNAKAMMEELAVGPTSRASADQRKGRAGRTQAGECIRLYTKYMFMNEMPSETVPEILRCMMSTVVLQLKALGIHDLLQFDFLDPPSLEAMERSLDHLYLLGAMRANGQLTKTGKKMAEFPMDPSLSRMLIRAGALGCARHAAMAAAILSVEGSLFLSGRSQEERKTVESVRDRLFAGGNGDVWGYISVFQQWLLAGARQREYCKANLLNAKSLQRALDVFDQLLKVFDRVDISYKKEGDGGMTGEATGIPTEALTRALLAGFFPNVAILGADSRSYRPIRPIGKSNEAANTVDDAAAALVEIHPSSSVASMWTRRTTAAVSDIAEGRTASSAVMPELVLFLQIRQTKRPFMMHVTDLTGLTGVVLEESPQNYFSPNELTNTLKKKF